ncbi:hypothetical protein BHE74_00003425 [Ensete ventricosum]|nr:hypothetical protein BHE74_00003425 [Ensete ventricosum]
MFFTVHVQKRSFKMPVAFPVAINDGREDGVGGIIAILVLLLPDLNEYNILICIGANPTEPRSGRFLFKVTQSMASGRKRTKQPMAAWLGGDVRGLYGS